VIRWGGLEDDKLAAEVAALRELDAIAEMLGHTGVTATGVYARLWTSSPRIRPSIVGS
jgi:hypothetical protein